MLFHKDMRGVRNSISAAEMCKRYIIYYILRAGCGAMVRNDYSAIIANEVDMTYEVWLKNNGTGRPADIVEDPQTNETHDINT